MIDRAALEQLAARQLAAMASPSGASVVLHLHAGARYTVHGFELPRDSAGASIFDRLVLPYEAIAFLTLTAREPEDRSTIGFHTP